MANGLDPRTKFYLPIAVANVDGTMDPGREVGDGYSTIEEALDVAEQDVDEHGGEVFIYECRPVRRLSRHTVVVETIGDDK